MFCDSVLFSLYSLLKPRGRPAASPLKYGIAVLMISLPQILPSSVHSSHCCQSNLFKTQIWSHQLLCSNPFQWITSGPRIKSKLLALKAVYAPVVISSHTTCFCTSPAVENSLQLFPALTMLSLASDLWTCWALPGMCSSVCLLWFLSPHSSELRLILEHICVSCWLSALLLCPHLCILQAYYCRFTNTNP